VGRNITWFLLGALTGAVFVGVFQKVRERYEQDDAESLSDDIAHRLSALEQEYDD
jgi:hypothetical protein